MMNDFGRSTQERLKRGPLPIDEVLQYTPSRLPRRETVVSTVEQTDIAPLTLVQSWSSASRLR